jgi:hypothetical protein
MKGILKQENIFLWFQVHFCKVTGVSMN